MYDKKMKGYKMGKMKPEEYKLKTPYTNPKAPYNVANAKSKIPKKKMSY